VIYKNCLWGTQVSPDFQSGILRNAATTRALSIFGALALLGAPQAGLSQQAPAAGQPEEALQSTGLQEVVVTAQKRSESSQRVPISISAVTADQLQASGINSSVQLQAIDPALQIQVTAGSFETRIRGVGTISDGPGVENPVALYVDGVYIASQVTGGMPLDDVKQVSVLKGPQGTLFGRNATGGVIQITTRDPSSTPEFEFSEDFDRYKTTRTDIYASGAISKSLDANLWAAYATQGQGWGTNLNTGRDDVAKINHYVDLRNKWVLSLGEDTTLKLNLDYMDHYDTNGLNIVPAPGTAAYTLVPGFQRTTNPWDTDILTTATNYVRGGGASLTLDTPLPFARLQNIAAYRSYDYFDHFSSTASPLPGVFANIGGQSTLLPGEDLVVRQRGEQITEELQLVSLDSSAIKWAGGLYYYYDDDRSPGTNINLLAPPGVVVVPIVVNTRTVTNSVAAFAQATVPLAWIENTNLTLGARDTYEHRAFAGSEFESGEPLHLPPISPTIEANRPTWRVSLDHNFTPDLMLYGAYNRGFKSGGYNGFDPTNPPYRPETVNAYELGFKSQTLQNTLRINGALFYDQYQNIQVSRYTSTAVIYNGAAANIYGGELSAQALVGRFQFGAATEMLHTRFASFPEAACSTPNFPAPGITQFSCSATGNQLPYAPKFTGNLSADYLQEVSPGTLDFNITEYHNSGYFAEPDNRLRQPSYDYLNSSVTLKSADGRYSVRLYGNNLLNRAVASFLATNATQYSADYGNPPRLFGVHLDWRL
jgi:iron complex outermembrane receptor protein